MTEREIILSKNAGFCPGVKRADELVTEIFSSNPKAKIYTLGHLIHNRIYNEELKSRGILAIEFSDIEAAIANEEKDVILITRTHGITKEESLKLSALENQYKNFKVYDTTCPYVKRIHSIAESNTSENTVFLLFCDPGHPEAKGILSYVNGEKHAFSSLEELKTIDLKDKTPVLASQTTQNLEEFKKIKNFLKKLCTNAIFFDTICSVTEIRQEESIALAENSDGMIVIGGKNSSNTQKLFALCKEQCDETICIEAASEIPADFPIGKQKIGITAGASTPGDIITEVLKLWK